MRVTRESRTSDFRLSFSEELQYLELYAVKKCDVFQRVDYTPRQKNVSSILLLSAFLGRSWKGDR